MEGSATSESHVPNGKGKGKATGKSTGGTKNRKYWSRAEEEALIIAVKELNVKGWKAGNGWRPGFYKKCAGRIQKQIPSSTIQGEPHVMSKIAVWKKEYGLLSGLFGASDQEINPEDYSIGCINTPKWDEACKVNKELGKMKNKSFPYFEQWQEMFGKDRANGVDAHDLGSTTQQILEAERQRAEAAAAFDGPPGVNMSFNMDTDVDVGSGIGDIPDSHGGQATTSRNRKAKIGFDEEPMSDMMKAFMFETKEVMVDVTKAIASLKEVDPAVTKVYAALEELPDFNMDQRIAAARNIVASQSVVVLFFNLTNEGKTSFVRSVLRGE